MSLTSISSLESARRKFFMNSTYMMSRKLGIKRFMRSGDRNDSKSHHLARIVEKKIFHELDEHDVLQTRNQTPLGSGGQNEFNSH